MYQNGSHCSFGININQGKYIQTIYNNVKYISKQPYRFQLKGDTEPQPVVKSSRSLSDAGMSFSVTLPNHIQHL